MHRGRRKTWTTIAIFLAIVGCGQTGGRLDHGARTIDGLVDEYVGAVVRGDTVAMHDLRLTEHEHNDLLWPELPASRPEFNMPISFAWENLDRHSRRDAARIIYDFKGRALDPVGVTCRKGVTQYATFAVHGDCWVTVQDKKTGVREDVKIFGSIVEMDGRYKIIGILSE